MLQLKNHPTFVPDMNNTRFATATHILTLLAEFPEEWLSSDWMAASINVNPVVVRKELSVLHEAGLVEGRKGKDGGSRLLKSADKIQMSDIYLAVKNSEILGKKNQKTNPKCPIGLEINNHLNQLFQETDQLVVDALSKKSLSDFVKKFH